MELKNKNIEKIFHLTDSIKEELQQVWEEYVRSSHHFLTEDDICYYRIRLKEVYLQAVALYVIRDIRIFCVAG